MSMNWVKAYVLMILIAVLLTVAITTAPKQGGSDENTANPDQSDTTPSASPSPSDDPFERPTSAPATDVPVPTSDDGDNGWVNVDGNLCYYIDGVLQKNTVVGNETEGYAYVNENGVRDFGYCNGLTIDGVDWNIIESRATRVEDEWDACLHSALIDIGKCTNSSMTRDEKLRAAFTYIQDDNNYLEGVRHDPPYNEMDWPVVCANDLFEYGMGDCFSYGAAFAFYGKAIGCEECYACNTGGHGWAEIDGKAYDPEFDMHDPDYRHFAVAPEDDNNVAYFTSLTEGVDWMKIKL